jgi:hypothetical protein
MNFKKVHLCKEDRLMKKTLSKLSQSEHQEEGLCPKIPQGLAGQPGQENPKVFV